MSQGHAFLPPSGASSWSECALWPTMNEKFPQDESAAAVEGTAAHWVAWEVLYKRTPLISAQTPNGQLVTQEMLEGGFLVADTFESRVPLGALMYVETPVEIPIYDSFGTPDLWAFDHERCHLEIFDYKFGHRFVDEFWNPQGLSYLSGIVEILSHLFQRTYADWEKYLTVAFTVIQPRCFYRGQPVRTHEFRFSECRPHFNALTNAAQKATAANPTATTNEHCGDCPGRHACDALQCAAYTAAEYSTRRNIVQLKPADAALELRILMAAQARLEARVEGLKEFTLANLKKGERVPFFRAEPGYGRTQWNIPEAQVIAIGQMAGKDLSKTGVITPNQAQKAGLDELIIKQFSFTSSTSTKLIPETLSDAARVFGR